MTSTRSPARSALDSPPFYCWRQQAAEVMTFARTLFVMTPCREVACAEQIMCIDNPIFIRVENHPHPVPSDIMAALRSRPGFRIVTLEYPWREKIEQNPKGQFRDR